ncbi:MAG: hypothetical protein LQ347_005388, partial [Umbilicaria vellea]
MPSKGLSLYTYISVPGCEVHFQVPGGQVTTTANDNFKENNLEVDSKNIHGAWNFTGRFSWRVVRNGADVPGASGYNDINSLTGNLDGGTMIRTLDTRSILAGDFIIAYGFYDAGPGKVGLTNRDQCYVAVTENQSAWMATLAPPSSPLASKPLSRFVLAAPHDPGMNTMQTVDALFNNPNGNAIRKLMVEKLGEVGAWFNLGIDALTPHIDNIIYGTAITQKDPIPVLLAMGARYFEFRPAHLFKDIRPLAPDPDRVYFTHAFIPGIAYEQFLSEIVSFLDQHPSEIVIVRLCWDGVVAECERPTDAALAAFMTAALAPSSTHLVRAGPESLHDPMASLRASGKRLLCLTNAPTYDSYSDSAYATLAAAPILANMQAMTTPAQAGADFTILQCQATPTNLKDVVVYSVLTANTSTSCLTETKAQLTSEILPWVRANALARLGADECLV